MRHVFRATLIGWEEKREGIWFDAKKYSKEEAEAQFKPYQGKTQKGHSYIGYEYDGKKYHDYYYMGLFKDDEMPNHL